MGNTVATPSHITPSSSSSRYASSPPSRPSTAGLMSSSSSSSPPSSGHNLRKMKSSSTLSSLGRLYSHANHSSASVVSRLSKSSTRPIQHPSGTVVSDRILDIGKPTQFEHGIHVEYNKDNGKYMGLPDVWQSNLPSDDVLDTNYINPNLVPSPANSHNKKRPAPSVRSATTVSSSSSSSATVMAAVTNTSAIPSTTTSSNSNASSNKSSTSVKQKSSISTTSASASPTSASSSTSSSASSSSASSTSYDPNKKPSLIGKPYNIQHHVHVEVDQYGFKGLPVEWQTILRSSGITEDIVNANPKTVQRLMHVRMPESLQQSVTTTNTTKDTKTSKSPPSPTLRCMNEDDDKYTTTAPCTDSSQLPVGFAPPSRARHSKLAPLTSRHSVPGSSSSESLASSLSDPSSDHVTDVKALPELKTHLDLDSSFIDDIVDHADPATLYTDFILVAEGESGPMYAAKQSSTSRTVAIKKISKESSQKLTKIRNELTTMKMSRHPNVVEFIACYTTDTEIWVVMEYMDVALSDIISIEAPSDDTDDDQTSSTTKHYCERMTEEQMARVARDVLRALGRLHKLGRIHRDIRSDNVLINMRGEIKLTDFSHCAQLSKAQPKRNSVIGTPYWMAPEVIKGQEYDAKADIWSLGVLMLEMAQGDPPYVEYPPLRALFLIASNGLPPFAEPDRWSDSFKDFVHLCTTVNPAKRPDATTLLRHPFVLSVATKEDIVQLLEETRRLEELMGSQEGDD